MADKVGIGIIGSGGIAKGAHMKGYAAIPEQCEIVAVCDVNEEAAKAAAELFGVETTYTDYHDLIKDERVHGVSVTTPNKFHKDPTIAALRAGKNVLCEKPLSMDAAESREMCDVARETGKILQVALQSRFTGVGRFLKQYIDAGHMGDVYFARAQALRRRGVPGWGVFIDKEKQGGGPLIDIGVHILDFTLFLMGYPKPVSASGKTWDMMGKNPELYNSWGDYDRDKFTVEDFAVGMIKFDNGAVISLESSFMANLHEDAHHTQIFGTKAGAKVNIHDPKSIEIYTEQDRQLFTMKPANVPNVENPYFAEVAAFVDAIANDKPSPVPGENGLILNAIFDALYKSSDSGKEEAVETGL
ncbi:Gfo/Idh/MocA family oxidoreductase [bacterium]|nr:MAG: Gfo/Idh/MocA family oxidoreductase [bacterium]